MFLLKIVWAVFIQMATCFLKLNRETQIRNFDSSANYESKMVSLCDCYVLKSCLNTRGGQYGFAIRNWNLGSAWQNNQFCFRM
jgi:hypothetical protein